ncbi:hypothetical protein ACFSTE_13305 [Aquimarina hainanensis]|uniref:DUF4352 domain-containing protein n=1 Tax=Aquimarina hainanensis TaxID=1578017 RepID=A0ABW5N953_9FLAO
MTIILTFAAISVCYVLIKVWIKMVDFFLKPAISSIEKTPTHLPSKIKVREAKYSSELSSKINDNNTVSILVDCIQKNDSYFSVCLRIKNETAEQIFYTMKDCFFISEKGLQIKSVPHASFEKNLKERILPGLYLTKKLSFSTKYSDFSQNDTIVCEIVANESSYLASCDLKSITDIALVS